MLEAGIHPKIAIAVCNLFSDPERYISILKNILKNGKMLRHTVTPGNNKPNPQDGDVA